MRGYRPFDFRPFDKSSDYGTISVNPFIVLGTNPTVKTEFEALVENAKACTICAAYLPLGPRPVFQIHPASRILIVSQAPGRKVHETGIPFNDASGNRLRDWMGVDRDTFYNPEKIAILPMGFCYPGTGSSGDLPPRPECAPAWQDLFLAQMPRVELKLIIGTYALKWHVGKRQGANLTETVKNWAEYWPSVLPLPHPSPRNNIWLAKNAWYEATVVPVLKKRVSAILNKT